MRWCRKNKIGGEVRWDTWFAWYPVKFEERYDNDATCWAWLEKVQRGRTDFMFANYYYRLGD